MAPNLVTTDEEQPVLADLIERADPGAHSDVLTNFGKLSSNDRLLQFHCYLEEKKFYQDNDLWGKPWTEFENDFLKPEQETRRHKYESVDFDEAFRKMELLTCAGEEKGDSKAYLADKPDKTLWRKADHQNRATMQMFDANRRLPQGIYYKDDAEEHEQKFSPSGDRKEFVKYLQESEDQVEQMWRVLKRKRDIWLTNNPPKTTKKPDVVKAPAAEPEPLEQRYSELPTGRNAYQGQMDIVFQQIGPGKPKVYHVNKLENLIWMDFMDKIIKAFKLDRKQQAEALLFLPEDYGAITERFDKSESRLTLEEIRKAQTRVTPETWAAIVKRACAQAFPLLAKLLCGRSTNKRKRQLTIGEITQNTIAKRLKVGMGSKSSKKKKNKAPARILVKKEEEKGGAGDGEEDETKQTGDIANDVDDNASDDVHGEDAENDDE